MRFRLAIFYLLTLLLLAGCSGPTTPKSASDKPAAKPSVARREAKKRVWASPAWTLGSTIRNDYDGLVVAMSTKYLSFTVGVEQWEHGKKWDYRHQTWRVLCDSAGQYCSIDRLVIDQPTSISPLVTTHLHSTVDGTLKRKRLDWKEGVAEFGVVLDDGETIDVELRFKKVGTMYLLTDFRAFSIHRSNFSEVPMSMIEYRVPKYTYTLNVALDMPGMSDGGLEKWDALYATLSEMDRKAWEQVRKEFGKWYDKHWESELRALVEKKLPNVDYDEVNEGNRILSEDEQQLVDAAIVELGTEKMVTAIRRSAMSSEAKDKLITYQRTAIAALTEKQ